MHIKLKLEYGQICVFLSALERPFNDWTQGHFDQGFAWREGSVCFRAMEQMGECSIEVKVAAKTIDTHEYAVRVIEVPFTVPANEIVEISSILESATIKIPANTYTLRCEMLDPSKVDGLSVRLFFTPARNTEFRVCRADPDLIIQGALLTSAEPA